MRIRICSARILKFLQIPPTMISWAMVLGCSVGENSKLARVLGLYAHRGSATASVSTCLLDNLRPAASVSHSKSLLPRKSSRTVSVKVNKRASKLIGIRRNVDVEAEVEEACIECQSIMHTETHLVHC